MPVTSTLRRRVLSPLALTSLLVAGACAGGCDNAGSPSTSASDMATTGASSGATAPSSPVSSAPSTPSAGSTSAAPSADVKVIAVRYRNGKVTPSPDRISVSKGQNVRIEVTSDATDEIHVHGYDLKADLTPGQKAVVSFRADQPGLYEVEVEDAGVVLFQLLVR